MAKAPRISENDDSLSEREKVMFSFQNNPYKFLFIKYRVEP